mmetsp:Transcript_38029/g.107430  ORF Transcript_38029/g.107430 Transcript_38029/m.107430 type:complete len:536 (+) Transcript_38029:486-2093(+)
MAEGWKFTVVVPSWTTHTILDESVVLYRVEVRVQAPGSEHTKTRSVLRRYSDFRRLHASLKAHMPARMKGKDTPAKKTFLRVNSNVELIEKRRSSLEEWLWVLLSDGEISRSRELSHFLELHAATGQQRLPSGSGVPSSSGPMSEGSVGEHGEPSSSGADDNDTFDQASTTGSDVPSIQHSAHEKAQHPNVHLRNLQRSPGRRMGLRVEQRPMVRRLLVELQERFEKAKADLADAVETAECERRAREMMAEKLADLMEQLEGRRISTGLQLGSQPENGGSSSRAGREGGEGGAAPSSGAGDEPSSSAEVLQLRQELAMEREATAALRQQLDEARQQHPQPSPSAGDEQMPSTNGHESAESVRKQMEEREVQLKGDMKVLAKEVKKLRKEAAQLTSRAEQAEAKAEAVSVGGNHAKVAKACNTIVELVGSLRLRLAACDPENMARDAEVREDALRVNGTEELIATSNNRIAALLAETQLLRNLPWEDTGAPALKELQCLVSDILTDVGLLRQQLNNSPRVTERAANGHCSHDSTPE